MSATLEPRNENIFIWDCHFLANAKMLKKHFNVYNYNTHIFSRNVVEKDLKSRVLLYFSAIV